MHIYSRLSEGFMLQTSPVAVQKSPVVPMYIYIYIHTQRHDVK